MSARDDYQSADITGLRENLGRAEERIDLLERDARQAQQQIGDLDARVRELEAGSGAGEPPERPDVSQHPVVLDDGTQVTLGDCDWVLWGPCGCPWGVTVGRYAPGEDDAWLALFDRRAEADAAKAAGQRLELMTHERYCREVSLRMSTRCIHTRKAGAR